MEVIVLPAQAGVGLDTSSMAITWFGAPRASGGRPSAAALHAIRALCSPRKRG